jgi:hypothetical protein
MIHFAYQIQVDLGREDKNRRNGKARKEFFARLRYATKAIKMQDYRLAQ